MIGSDRLGAPSRTSPRQAILVDAGDLRPPNDPRAEQSAVP